jgi:hypothetical protein
MLVKTSRPGADLSVGPIAIAIYDPSETLVVRRNNLCPRSIPALFQSARLCY